MVSFNFNDSFQWLVAVFIQLVYFIAQFRLSYYFSTAIVCGYQLFVNIYLEFKLDVLELPMHAHVTKPAHARPCHKTLPHSFS